jgi:hypothetical protein
VEFLICGGHAVSFHGYPRMTMDMDILIKPNQKNARRLMTALNEFGFGQAGIPEEAFLKEGTAVTLGVQPNQIDLLSSVSKQNVENIFKNAILGKLENFSVLYISKQDLLRAKREAGRPKDIADLDELEKMDNKPQTL